MKRALILVDIQHDFLPGGALAVQDGDAIIPIAARLARDPRFDLVVATKDWHPVEHKSFAANHPGRKPFDVIDLDGIPQVLWPVHCVQHSQGATLAKAVEESLPATRALVVTKGENPQVDSYSAFFDNGRRIDTGLAGALRKHGIDEVVIAGLALDYCVKATALDAARLGFSTTVLIDATRAVEASPGDGDKAMTEMRSAGIRISRSADA